VDRGDWLHGVRPIDVTSTITVRLISLNKLGIAAEFAGEGVFSFVVARLDQKKQSTHP